VHDVPVAVAVAGTMMENRVIDRHTIACPRSRPGHHPMAKDLQDALAEHGGHPTEFRDCLETWKYFIDGTEDVIIGHCYQSVIVIVIFWEATFDEFNIELLERSNYQVWCLCSFTTKLPSMLM
jgi:hypothetical protein